MEESHLRPSWRLIDIPNNKKSQTGQDPGKKMLVYDVGSGYVYENKQNCDKMPNEMSDIYGKVTGILQKIADFEGQFAVICSLRASFRMRKSRSAQAATTRDPSPPRPAKREDPSLLRRAPALLGEGFDFNSCSSPLGKGCDLSSIRLP
jgi:hypothetical protein